MGFCKGKIKKIKIPSRPKLQMSIEAVVNCSVKKLSAAFYC